MLFNSLHFIIFFLLVTPAFFLLPHKHRWKLVLAASCYFYMVFMPVYILILGFTIVVDYFVGIYLARIADPVKKKRLLVVSLFVNIGVLAVFKYYNFLNENLSAILNAAGYENHIPNLSILLPIGLSFHTFQAMSYTIEVYRGNHPPERHFGIYALYVMYYPQLVAGPIERPQNVLWQFHKPQIFEYKRVTDGLKLMTWGFFKKVVVADRIAPLVDHVYNDPENFYGFSLIIATVLFAFQIYADFSGYSDIAIGASAVMGIKLMTNFRQPYFSFSVSEFWKRWHISLSTWFRDYLYIPLGGNRTGRGRHLVNLMITFLISGIWHGANWTFVAWGALHGVFLILEHLLKGTLGTTTTGRIGGLKSIIRQLLTFGMVCVAWIFFRAATIQDAMYILSNLLTDIPGSAAHFIQDRLGAETYTWAIIFFALGLLFTVEFIQQKISVRQWLDQKPAWIRWGIYTASILIILGFGQYETQTQFIYFQF